MTREEALARICIALDEPDLDTALVTVRRLWPLVDIFKVGAALFMAHGPKSVRQVMDLGGRVFLDLKLHDIPMQVGRAVEGVVGLGAAYLTVHASGGLAMLRTAARAAEGTGLKLLGVTLLTSLDREEVRVLFGHDDVPAIVARMAHRCAEAGIAGCVLSAGELHAVRKALGEEFMLVTPGITRLGAQSRSWDQCRTGRLSEVLRLGADMVVVGRAVTSACDPRAALLEMLEEEGLE